MHITFQNPGFEYSLQSIMLFQTEEQSPFWSDPLLHFYPQIDRNEMNVRNFTDRKAYLDEILQKIYENTVPELDCKAICYHDHFMKYKCQIEDALSDAFQLDARLFYNDLTGNITLNPICPRFLNRHSFDIFYKNSEKGALGLSLHEVIHFFWFHVWSSHFGDLYDEYETPSLKWILSEMVVEAIMSDQRLSSINPYFPKENGGCIYPYFQNMLIDGMPILEKISDYYQKNTITDFMEIAYAYCTANEQAIRQHIMAAESAF